MEHRVNIVPVVGFCVFIRKMFSVAINHTECFVHFGVIVFVMLLHYLHMSPLVVNNGLYFAECAGYSVTHSCLLIFPVEHRG